MRRLSRSALPVAAAMMLSGQTWPYPDDVPRLKPVAVGLAGAAEPDITRLLLAHGPRAG